MIACWKRHIEFKRNVTLNRKVSLQFDVSRVKKNAKL